jgi:glutamyl-tRNA reductase
MNNLHLVMIGVHQRTTPLAIRERLAFPPEARALALATIQEHAHECVILSTCNRTEIYAILPERPDLQPILAYLAHYSGLSDAELTQHLALIEGSAVARHICRMAAGLDSMVLGEDQIVGQLKEAMAAALQQQALGQHLQRLVQHALAAGKAARSQTGIARQHLSVVSVALDVARQQAAGFAGKQLLIIGAGETAGLLLKHLRNEHQLQLTLANRTLANAQLLASRYGAQAIGLAELPVALATADIVISCTSSPEIVVYAHDLSAVRNNHTRPLVLVDLAVPHDIDPSVTQMAGVRLVTLDALQTICRANYATRAAEVAHAEAIIDAAVAKFSAWWRTQLAMPTIRALRKQAEAIRAAEVERTLARLPQLSGNEQAAIHALSEAIVNKLLHHPVITLKDEAGNSGLLGATQRLFQIEVR